MKILQINTVFKTGGSTGRIVYDLKCVMDNENIENYVAFGYGYNPTDTEKGEIYRIESNRELFVSKVYTKLIGHHGFNNGKETRRLLEWIDSINPDLIHLHNIHNHYINIKLLLEYITKNKIPCVLTMHDCWTFTGHCAYFDYSGCNKWITGCNKCPSLRDYPKTFTPLDPSQWNYRNKCNLFTSLNITFTTPSNWLKGLVRQSFLKDKQCVVINNGVDINVFKPCGDHIKHRHDIDDKTLILAMASGFNKRKGIDYLLQIPDLLRDNEVLMLVGVTQKQKKQLSTKRCIAIEQTNNVKVLAEYYSAADVFINPTLEDNFPTTNIESLACGTPVITFNTGGSVESVLDDERLTTINDIIWTSVGAVVPQNNVTSLLIAVREICKDGKSKFQNACRKKAELKYDKTKQYKKYIDLYKSIIIE